MKLTKPFVEERNVNGMSKMIQLKRDLYLGQAIHKEAQPADRDINYPNLGSR